MDTSVLLYNVLFTMIQNTLKMAWVAGKQARRKKDTTSVEARMIFLLHPNIIKTKANFTGQIINDL